MPSAFFDSYDPEGTQKKRVPKEFSPRPIVVSEKYARHLDSERERLKRDAATRRAKASDQAEVTGDF